MTYNKDNVFYKIIHKNAESSTVYENDHTLVIKNLYPRAPIHFLVMPKGEYTSYTEFGLNASPEEKLSIMDAINTVIRKYHLEEKGYRLVANTGDFGGQSVPHFHIHLLGGQKLDTFGL